MQQVVMTPLFERHMDTASQLPSSSLFSEMSLCYELILLFLYLDFIIFISWFRLPLSL